MKKLLSVLIVCLLVISSFTGCGEKESEGASSSETADTKKDSTDSGEMADGEEVTVTIAIMSNVIETYFNENDIAGAYKKSHPNVNIEIEKLKDSGAFEEAMKIRAAAGELPDLMTFKPYMLSSFSDQVMDLGGLEAAENNLYAKDYAIDGKVVGLPEITGVTYVFYWKSIFEELDIEIPQTWGEFIEASVKIKENSDIIPIMMGAKDAWADYPFNEYMPALEADDGALWNTMAAMDEPFSPDQPFNIAYQKIQDLYDAKVFGVDPLGLSFDQAKGMFGEKQGAMISGGVWLFPFVLEADAGNDDLGSFFLPTRNDVSEPFRTISQADAFWSISDESEVKEEAQEFLNWYFSSEWYDAYIKVSGDLPTVEGVEVTLPKELQQSIDQQPDLQVVMYDGGNKDFSSIVSETKFDVKVLGQEMMIDGFDLDKKLAELNEDWTAARERLNIE